MKIPIIPNIHQSILNAINDNSNKLDMGKWHSCSTTHCRAGWVIHLAGDLGYKLEKQTDPVFAAMQIYKKASPQIPVSPARFFDGNKEAMADIVKCAELEKANQ